MGTEHLTATLALVGIVIIVAALLSGAVERSGLPQVAIFLALGALLGPAGLALLDIPLRSTTLQVIATLALVLVLFSDAMSVDMGEVRRQRRLALVVLGPGTLLPALLIALAAWLLLDVSAPGAAILGAALASTDPVLLRNLLRHPELPPTTKLVLRMESGMNDVVLLPVVVLAMLVLRTMGGVSGVEVVRSAVGLFFLGPALGALIGWIAITVLDRVRRNTGVRRDYESIYALGVALAAFTAAEAVGGSGFLAAFTAGLVIAVLDVELCDCFLDYGEATAEMFLLLAFVAFGASVIWTGATMVDWRTMLFALIALGARTAVLYPVLTAARVDERNRRLIAWLGPRGLSSLLLALLPVFAGIPGAERLFNVTCLTVLLSVLLHGGGIATFLLRRSSTAGAVAAPEPTPIPASGPRALPMLDDGTTAPLPRASERITIDEMLELQARGEEVTIVDARKDRAYRGETTQAKGAVRIAPDDAVRSAREKGLSQRGTVVIYCA